MDNEHELTHREIVVMIILIDAALKLSSTPIQWRKGSGVAELYSFAELKIVRDKLERIMNAR